MALHGGTQPIPLGRVEVGKGGSSGWQARPIDFALLIGTAQHIDTGHRTAGGLALGIKSSHQGLAIAAEDRALNRGHLEPDQLLSQFLQTSGADRQRGVGAGGHYRCQVTVAIAVGVQPGHAAIVFHP